VELDGRQPIINTLQHLAWNLKGEFVGKSGVCARSVGRWSEDMKGYLAMMNHTNCVDL